MRRCARGSDKTTHHHRFCFRRCDVCWVAHADIDCMLLDKSNNNTRDQLNNSFLDGTSLRSADGRVFWVHLRRLRECVYACWDFWPMCRYPENKPAISEGLLQEIADLMSILQGHLYPVDEIPLMPWCIGNWKQLEIATRHLALHIDSFFEEYDPTIISPSNGLDSRVNMIRYLKMLTDYMNQLYWWLCALNVWISND